MEILSVVQENPISYDKLKKCILNNEHHQILENSGKTALHIICLNKSITYEILELIINSSNYESLITKDKYKNTALMKLFINKSITYEILKLMITSLNYEDLIAKDIYESTPLLYLCNNESLTYDMLELFVNILHYNDLIIEDNSEFKLSALKLIAMNENITYPILKLLLNNIHNINKSDTILWYLCDNKSITYDLLELLFFRLNYSNLIAYPDSSLNTPLLVLCTNSSVTYEMLELLISKLYCEDLYLENKYGKNPLNYLNINLDNIVSIYKLFITKFITKEKFIDCITMNEYNKYKEELDLYFEIVNNDYSLK